MAVKPIVDPKWSTNNAPEDNIEPTTGLKLAGVQSGVAWGREHLNWQFYAISQWVDYVRAQIVDKDNNLSEIVNKDTALANLGGTTVGRGVFKATNAGVARTALGMGTVGSALTTAVTKKDAMRTILPAGITYTQYPGSSAPSDLFGGTWEKLFDEEGVFFRTEGGNASAFNSGIQNDELKSHYHTATSHINNPITSNANQSLGGGGGNTNTQTDPYGGVQTRPINRTIVVGRKVNDIDP